MKIYMHYEINTRKFKGFFIEGIHINIPIPNIQITEALWKKLLLLTNDFKLKDKIPKKLIFTEEDFKDFEIIPFEYEDPKPTRLDLLEDRNAKLILDQAHNLIRLNKLEEILKPSTLDLKYSGSNINNWYEDIKIYYDKNNYKVEEMKLFVLSNMITEDQYKTITGLDY